MDRSGEGATGRGRPRAGTPGRFRAGRLPRALPWALPYAMVLVGLIVNLLLPRGIAFTAAFAAAPLIAAALWTFRGTVAVSAVTVVAMVDVVFWMATLSLLEACVRLGTIVVVCLLAVGINRSLHRSVMRLASARRVAEAVQLSVLPTPPARVGELSVAVRYAAAQEGARLGGDLYAVERTPHGVRMLVADVRGKGLPAVDAVTVILGAFREAAERAAGLCEVAGWLEHALERERRERDGVERAEGFVTAVLAEIPAGDPETLRIVNRGHPPPLLLRDGAVEPLEPGSFSLPLGLGELGEPAPEVESVRFPPGALLLLYTDGVSEARDAGGAFYDPVEQLTGRRFGGPAALLEEVMRDVTRHTGGVTSDDLALLAVARAPGGSHPLPA
ncbi:PP2C family protein-serine/threonine phosphatase [Streptomyces zingiberis]|uniref:Serine/threonine-protein phosphatase n=1 Tax=Streptomyces zingiberis TaxID=2053010 RepID=A0ABX1C5V8_9ACTN|nr:PP2C family protein-serine/threonine phosphatase [Streptomyces zingiberis]NJQ03292.1 serine/threonine-protein phosphatase [Streptomyces zingiberis]